MEKSKLLSIMIVDDEMLVRTGISSFLNWNEFGYAITAQAANGLEALEMIRESCPDIILLDIKMPEMDGLELLRILKREQLPVKVIVLSCHNELEYVKESIRLGAEDYILKLSLRPENLLAKLSEIRKIIETEKNENTGPVRESYYNDRDDLLYGLITGRVEAREAECFSEKAKRLLVLRPTGLPNTKRPKSPPTPLQQRSMANLCKGISPPDWKMNTVSLTDNCHVLFLRSDSYIADEDVTDFFSQLKRGTQHYLSLCVTAGVSASFTSLQAIQEAYQQALKALDKCFYLDAGALVFYSPDLTFPPSPPALSAEQEELLRRHVMNGDASAAKHLISDFFNEVSENGLYSPDHVRFAAVEILHGLSKTIPRSRGFEENALFSAEILADLRGRVFGFIDSLIQAWKESRTEARHPGLLRAKQYILSNINRPVTLAEAADAAGMSKCYFSTMFAQETGESLTNYMNRIKIEHAKALLLRDGLSNSEAAERIGIFDVSYFGKLFKKYTGKSPSLFRRAGE